MGTESFEIDVAAPFRLDLCVWTLRRRPHNAIDEWEGEVWRRSVPTGDRVIGLRVAQSGTRTDPRLAVALDAAGSSLGQRAIDDARRLLVRVLGLERDLSAFYDLAESDPQLAPLADRFVGMRPPRFPTTFEALVNAVACQQLSLDVGIHLLTRLARHFDPDRGPEGRPPAFPTARQLMTTRPEELRAFGFSGAKAKTLIALGQQIATGEVDLEGLDDVDDRAAMDVLERLWGIGRWSAEYTLLRGLGRLDVLPGDDVGARNRLRHRFGLAEEGGYEAMAELSRRWWPFGGLVYFHLLLDRLADEGVIAAAGRAEHASGCASGGGGR